MSKKASDNLFRLIKSLSSPEKRYFKVFSSRHTLGEQNNYVKLFDAIDAQGSYDEASILQKFRKEAFINKFSIAKARLNEAILRSLDAFHSSSSIDAVLKRELHCAEILYKKTLYGHCAKALASAKRLALKYEKHSTLLEIFQWEKRLIEKDNYAGLSEKEIDNLLRADELIAEKIRNFNEYWNIKSRFFQLLNRTGKVRNQEELANFKKIIDNTLLKAENKALSYETKYLFYHIYSAYYFGIGDYEKSYQNLKRNVELIESNTEMFKEEPNIYFSVLTNIIYIASQLKKYDEVFIYLKKLREVPQTMDTSKNEDLEVKLFSSAYSIELTLYNQMGDFEKALALEPKIEEGLEKYSGKMNKVREAYFYSNIAIANYAMGKHSAALKWINGLLNNVGIEESQDIHCFTQLLNLIVHMELKNDRLLPYTFKSTHRYLSSRNRVYKFENAFLDFTGKIMKAQKREEQTKYYKELHSKLLELANDPFEKTVFEYFDFISWTESRIERVPFRQIVEEKAQVR